MRDTALECRITLFSPAFMLAKLLYNYTAGRPCRLIKSNGKRYLERYFVGQILGYTFYLHRFVAADGDHALHDHPWKKCLALCLVGGYQEKRLRWFDPKTGLDSVERSVRPGKLNAIGANTFHQILSVIPGTWTLFIHSKKIKGWGFLQATCGTSENGNPEINAVYNADPDIASHKNWWQNSSTGEQSDRSPLLLD